MRESNRGEGPRGGPREDQFPHTVHDPQSQVRITCFCFRAVVSAVISRVLSRYGHIGARLSTGRMEKFGIATHDESVLIPHATEARRLRLFASSETVPAGGKAASQDDVELRNPSVPLCVLRKEPSPVGMFCVPSVHVETRFHGRIDGLQPGTPQSSPFNRRSG